MGRRRLSSLILPPGVYRHGRKFRMRTYGEDRRPRWHYFKSRTEVEFFKEWSRYLKGRQVLTMQDVFERYAAQEIPKKARDTQISDRKALDFLSLAFGSLDPESVKPSQIVAYIDARGRQAPIRANREIALLSHIFTKCRHWEIVEHNPAQKLRYRNPETPRDRYVTDPELWRALRIAPPLIRYAIYFAVSTGLRRRDILSMKWSQFSPDGLTVTLSKSKRKGRSPKRLLFEWSPGFARLFMRVARLAGMTTRKGNRFDLEDVLATVERRRGTLDSPVFEISESAYGGRWSRFQSRLAGVDVPRFQMKDLRAKYATDVDARGGNATRALAHSSPATTQRHYQRKPTRINTGD